MLKTGADDCRVTVAGVDCSGDLGVAIKQAAAMLTDADLEARISGESVILELCDAADESAYLARLLRIFGGRTQLSFSRMRRPAGGEWKARILEPVRRVLWSLMRYPHDWVAFQQSAINEQAMKTLALEVQLRVTEAAALRARVEALEKALALTTDRHDGGVA